MKYQGRKRSARTGIRFSIPLLILVLVIVASVLIIYSTPVLTIEKRTSGNLTFIDGAGDQISGTIEISMIGAPPGRKDNVNLITWKNAPNAWIYFDAHETKSVSMNLRISDDSPSGVLSLEDHGAALPKSVAKPAPGTPVKYVEMHSSGVEFTDADISIYYTDAEIGGMSEKSLVIYSYDGGIWNELTSKVDSSKNAVSATVNSFTIFAISSGANEEYLKQLKTNVSSSSSELNEEIETDELKTKGIAVKLKLKNRGSGQIKLEDHGKKNPVKVAPPGKGIKFVDISAPGIGFESATVIIQYTDEELGSMDEKTLVIYHWNGASWDALLTSIDAYNNLLTATTTSLSPFAISGGAASGSGGKILVSTNRYVILDDPIQAGKFGSGFGDPFYSYTGWTYWTGINTRINATALFMDDNGLPLSGKIVTFNLYQPNGTEYTAARVNATTNTYGLANFSFDMDARNYYGNWTVKASNSSLNDSTRFIYNWWGCAYNSGDCSNNHNADTPITGGTINSPYSSGRDQTMNKNAHDNAGTNCTFCHQSFDGRPGDTNPPSLPGNDPNHLNIPSDVHRNITCDNVNCHNTLTDHVTNAVIGSCYNAACHKPSGTSGNRSDISNKSTLSGPTVATALSEYSKDNGTDFNGTFHTPDSTVPCIICHGPMHNITKPDETQRFIKNTNTEASQCKTCHTSYTEHNSSNTTSRGVNCTLCHSDDVHDMQLFSQQAGYVSIHNTSYVGNCTSCHQNSTFYSILKAQSKAGNQTGRNPPLIGTSLKHTDDPRSGNEFNFYWTPLDQAAACNYCHGYTNHKSSALGRPGLFNGTNKLNSTIGSSTWCQSCHYPYYNNYTNMTSTFIEDGLNIPPSIIEGTDYYIRGRNHTVPQNDTNCYLCHNGSNTYATISQFMHGVYVGGGGPDCLSCHDVGSNGSVLHVNNTVMNISFHANLNNQTVNSSNVPAGNKKCWGCHQSDGSQPSSSSMGDKYTVPYTCDECHLIGNEPYPNMSSAPHVTNHIWLDSSITRIITPNATCSTCHNNSVNLGIANITDLRSISAIESVSHYGSITNIIDTIGDVQTSQGCVYCHLTANGLTWGYATDPRNSTARPHTETRNDQCILCHVETVTPPDSFHNSSMYYAGDGKILVAADRYVILDDPRKPAGAKADTGFALPLQADYSSWNYWSGINTKINATALYVDQSGIPVSGIKMTFTIYWPNGTALAIVNDTTNVNGLANFSYDIDSKNYYGTWKIRANNGSLGANTTFIYNWWGCSFNGGTCSRDHSSRPPVTGGTINSPYTSGRDATVDGNSNHYNAATNCTWCHQSYDGNPGDTNPATGDGNFLNVGSDVHRNITCSNVNCHNTLATHQTNAVIGSCYNSACHTPANRSDLTNKSTLSGVVSIYSSKNGTNSMFHTPNSTVPCIICHGPMHAITKTDTTLRFIKNNITEYTHCLSCHQDYVMHNRTVSCPVCHSEDVHSIKVLAQNATYITYNHDNPNPARGNCTNCHQNSSFFSALLSRPNAGSFTGQPEQVASPLEHSNDPTAGQKWNQTPGYWSNQVTSCGYCHSSEVHSPNILGEVSFFKGNNTVNSTISATSSWCSSCHWQGYTNGTSIYTDMSSLYTVASKAVPPEISGNLSYGANQSHADYTNHSSYGKDDASCFNCHNGNLAASATMTDFMHNVSIGQGGGANCITCHNLVTGLSGGAPSGINFTAANSSVHNGTNSNNATQRGFAPVVGSCWACHDSDGNVSSGHPDRYTTPKTCSECHLGSGTYNGSSYNATIVSEHYYSGTDIRAGNATSNISSCINCHENTSEMILYNNDTDTGSFSGDGIRLNGGNLSFYHYGKQRRDLRAGTSANCSYCHQNISTAFASSMINSSYNRSISNHSLIYNSSNPSCISSSCHNTGWLHNATLAKPAVNTTYCLSCHGSNGSGGTNYSGAVTGIKEKHNNSVTCAECHINTSKDIHPAKYLRSNATYSSSNSSAANCVTCHQTTDVDSKLAQTPPKINSHLYHSDNTSNGTIWNSTAYWTPTSPVTACIYCHNDTKHNATGLGRPADWKGNNTINSSIASGTWCASCHYQGYSSGSKNYTNMTRSFTNANISVPPEITNGTYARNIYIRSDYYNHSLRNYSDEICRQCHGINISSTATITSFMHNVTKINTCTDCHYSFNVMNNTTKPEMFVDQGMYNTSLHRSLTCSNCHTQGHRNIGARKACEDCHAVQADPINDKDRHNITSTPGTYYYNSVNVVNITTCTTCHSGTLYNTSIATYGYWKQKDCDYCHTYPDKYYE